MKQLINAIKYNNNNYLIYNLYKKYFFYLIYKIRISF